MRFTHQETVDVALSPISTEAAGGSDLYYYGAIPVTENPRPGFIWEVGSISMKLGLISNLANGLPSSVTVFMQINGIYVVQLEGSIVFPAVGTVETLAYAAANNLASPIDIYPNDQVAFVTQLIYGQVVAPLPQINAGSMFGLIGEITRSQ